MKFTSFRNFILISSFFGFTVNSHAQRTDTISVLFIGNSFTFMNDMPDLFKGIAESKGKKVFVQKSVKEGRSFEYHATTKATYDAIRSRKWDYVVLQEQSNMPAQPEAKINTISLPYARQLADSIRKNNPCSQIMLYLTWAYKDGNSNWKEIANYKAMQDRISATYLRYADILNAQISPVGEVWRNTRNQYPGLDLYYKDAKHPSYMGSYLSACTFFCSIFGESAYGAKFIGKLDKYNAEIIQLSCSQTVLNNINQWRLKYERTPLRAGFDATIKGVRIKLYDRSEGAYSIEWVFPDGTTSKSQNPTYNCRKHGKFIIKQIVRDACNEKVLEREFEVD